MRVLFVVDGGVEDPATRARVLALLPALGRLGIEARVLEPGPARKWRLLPAARHADVVVLQRVLPPPPLLRTLRRAARALVLDFDDALATVPSLRPRFDAVVAAADAIVAGSKELARSAPGAVVVPTVVDPAAYRAAAPSEGPLRLGWIGTAQNLPYLELLRPALGGREDVVLRVISSSAPGWPDVHVEHVRWTLDGAGAALAQLDVGLVPLPDTPWTRGKCGYKALEYMATGLPVVASPVGALATIVVPEQTGLHAADVAGWATAVERLRDPELRARLGAAGRRRVEERYSVEVAAPLLAEVLASASKSRA